MKKGTLCSHCVTTSSDHPTPLAMKAAEPDPNFGEIDLLHITPEMADELNTKRDSDAWFKTIAAYLGATGAPTGTYITPFGTVAAGDPDVDYPDDGT